MLCGYSSLKTGAVVLGLCIVSLAFADNTVILPGFVVRDNNNTPIGPVVGVTSRDNPVVRMLDTTNNVPVFVEVRTPTGLVVTDERTYFSMTDCQGTAYHEVPFEERGLSALTGHMHSVARVNGGNQQLFASDSTAAGSSIMYQSQYLNTGPCSNSSSTITLRVATSVLDIDAAHPTPYTAGP